MGQVPPEGSYEHFRVVGVWGISLSFDGGDLSVTVCFQGASYRVGGIAVDSDELSFSPPNGRNAANGIGSRSMAEDGLLSIHGNDGEVIRIQLGDSVTDLSLQLLIGKL
ncbi:MAG: hypothetical protein IJY47_05635 [Clostridia bacterium]|nr:hypothetical protein [Clostridia bacterium]